MRTEKIDIYREITNQIIKAIEAGAEKYEMPWHVKGADSVFPANASTHRAYRGVNILMLWAVATNKAYETSLWATYQQWRELGAQVRKGEKATSVVFWKLFDKEETDEQEAIDGDTRKEQKSVMARAYSVFNAAQVDGYTIPAVPQLPESQRIARAEQFFQNLGAEIREGGLRAYYSPAGDYIQMPVFTAFKKVDYRYSVLAHEVTHWTGAPARLNRDLALRFQKEAYAAEELVAELGSAFTCVELGLEIEPRRDHAPYIQSWLQVLQNDKRAIFTAAAKAQQAVDWLFQRELDIQETAA
ncbi:MAG: zincin-like metallopeptidase domain-containing protein [Acidobacteriota bacterium]|nr:zincin-like metallopeptidase domain-containing protein [Acidobacteriota bacterium]